MKSVEIIVANGRNCSLWEQFLLWPQWFQKSSASEASESIFMLERVNKIIICMCRISLHIFHWPQNSHYIICIYYYVLYYIVYTYVWLHLYVQNHFKRPALSALSTQGQTTYTTTSTTQVWTLWNTSCTCASSPLVACYVNLNAFPHTKNLQQTTLKT